LNQLLVVLDPDREAAQPALDKAARLADGHPVSVFVNVRATSLEKRLASGSDALDKARQRIQASWREHVESLAQDVSLTLDEVRVVWSGDTYRELLATIEQWHPAMVVVHSHYEPRLKRLLFTPLEWKLIRGTDTPLLFASNQHWGEHPPVVAALDPDPLSDTPDTLTRRIVEHGRHWATRLDASLTLVHALEHPDETLVMLAGEEIPTSIDTSDAQRRFYEQRMEAVRASEDLDPEQVQLIEGKPARALADYMASLPPGLLVMGTVQKNSVERLLLGNTAEEILFQSASDVLVLHNPDTRWPRST